MKNFMTSALLVALVASANSCGENHSKIQENGRASTNVENTERNSIDGDSFF